MYIYIYIWIYRLYILLIYIYIYMCTYTYMYVYTCKDARDVTCTRTCAIYACAHVYMDIQSVHTHIYI